MTAAVILTFLVLTPLTTVAFVVLIKLVCTVQLRIGEWRSERAGRRLAKAWGIAYPKKDERERMRKRYRLGWGEPTDAFKNPPIMGGREGNCPCRKP